METSENWKAPSEDERSHGMRTNENGLSILTHPVDSYFWVGLGSEPDETGIPVPDEAGSLSPLRRYRGQNLVLSLPSGTDIFDIDWISIWSKGLGRSLAHVNVPAMTLNVPPALETLGIQSQVRVQHLPAS